MAKILISSCLLGSKVRYNGTDIKPDNEILEKIIRENEIISFCPEVSAGLPIPRTPAEISSGGGEDVISGSSKVKDKTGADVTEEFIRGAELALELCRKEKIELAVLAERSPSCGSSLIYDGTFSGRLVKGKGVTTALLEKSGIRVFSQFSISALQDFLADD